MALSPSDKLGPYEIVAPIGKGSMGARYAPPRARKSDEFGLAGPNNRNGG